MTCCALTLYPLSTNTYLVDRAAESEKLEQASKFFREKQYKQHHHPVHALHSKYEETSYLDSIAINKGAKHDMPTVYLDTLSNAKSSSWDVYKHKLEDAKLPNEVDGKLKQGRIASTGAFTP